MSQGPSPSPQILFSPDSASASVAPWRSGASEAPPAPPAPPLHHRNRSLRVLFFEDSPTDALLIQVALEGTLHPPLELTNVSRLEDGLRLLAQERFDAALLDLNLPDSVGLSTVQRLRYAAPELPLVVLTGTDDVGLVTRILAHGAQDYLLKQDVVGTLLAKAVFYAVERHRVAVELERRTRALLDSEARIREQAALIDAARDAILVISLEGLVMFWNRSAQRIHEWAAEDVLGRDVRRFLYREPALINEAWTSLRERGEWVGELWTVTATDRQVLTDTRLTLIRDAEGRPRSILAISTDITERKKLETEFLRAQRMDCLGTLAGGIAHDLNNVLTPITLAVGLLREDLPPGRPHNLLDTIAGSTQRATEMIRQVLTFARGVDSRRVPLQPRDLIEEVVRMFNDTFLKSVRVTTTLQPDIWPILGDRTQLHQVFLNLGVNARDAMPGGGHLHLEIANTRLESTLDSLHLPGRPGPYVVFTVADTGTGIAPEILDQIFHPFFTTKPHGLGTGLGLSTVQGIVKSHDGFITVDSEVGRGTIIKVFLPAAASPDTPPS